jgi:hypothetical protein
MFFFSRLARSSGSFGSSHPVEPAWIRQWENNNRRRGKDAFDWFFRLFNKTRIYENILKSNPRFYAFIVGTASVGTFFWASFWDSQWERWNQGKLYKHVPYVYPIKGED